MNFEEFLKAVEKEFRVERTVEETFLVSRDGRTVEVVPRETCSYTEFLHFFERATGDGVGSADLRPSELSANGHLRGSLVGKDDPLFGRRELRRDDPRFPRHARFDPLVPSKDRTRGFDPDPDHFPPYGPNRSGFF